MDDQRMDQSSLGGPRTDRPATTGTPTDPATVTDSITVIHAAIWVERLTRTGEVLTRERCHSHTVLIGRGYTNDVVIDDPTVAERHLRVFRAEDGSLHAEDLGSLNGLFLGPRGEGVRKARVDGDQPLRIGATWLRVRSADHPVPAEQPMPVQRRLWPISLGLALACAALEALDLWRGQTAEIQWLHQISSTLMTFAAVLGWTSAWAVIGRIFSHSAKYAQHLVIAFAGLLAVGVVGDLTPLLAYSLSLSSLPSYQFIATTALFATMVIFHLRLVLHTHRRMQLVLVGALALLFVVLDILKLQSPGVGRTTTYVLHELAPPALRLVTPQSQEDFFAANQQLKSELDHARSAEQPEEQEDVSDEGDEE
jgi:hypothetical protein